MKTLLIVDLQKGFLNDNCNFVVEKIEKLVKKGNFDRIVATKFVNSKNSQYQKFLNYGKFCSKTETDLALKLPKDAQIVEKTSYALRGGDFDTLFTNKDEQIFVCGVDYDACVLATSFQIFDHQMQPHILIDCVASYSQKPISKQAFKKICLKNFGKDCLIKSTQI